MKSFNDHFSYTQDNINEITAKAVENGAELILTTEKDWTKISKLNIAEPDVEIGYIPVEIEFINGMDELIILIESGLDSTI